MIIPKINSAVSKKESQFLFSISKDKKVLEVGSLLGYSTILLAQQSQSVTAIDPHDGYPFWSPSPTFELFQNNIKQYHVFEKVKSVIGLAQEILPRQKEQFDVAFVDTTGFYSDTMFCLNNIEAPTILVHDFYRQNCEGSTQAVLDFTKKNNRKLTQMDTLAIIE